MIPNRVEIEALHHKYAQNDHMFALVFVHCQIVAEISLWCADQIQEKVDRHLLEVAALLHDMGSYGLMTEQGKISSKHTYVQHALLGAKILQDEGVDERIVQMVETHLQLGVTKDQIISQRIALPARDYIPQSIEAEILCYADKFHSKSPLFNALETYTAFLQEKNPGQIAVPCLEQKIRHPGSQSPIPKVQPPHTVTTTRGSSSGRSSGGRTLRVVVPVQWAHAYQLPGRYGLHS